MPAVQETGLPYHLRHVSGCIWDRGHLGRTRSHTWSMPINACALRLTAGAGKMPAVRRETFALPAKV